VLKSSAYLDQFSSINPYQIEASGTVSIGFLVDRVSQNLDKYGLTFFPRAFAPFLEFRSPHTWTSNGLALLIDLLLLYFIIVSIRRSRKAAPIGVYLLLYLTVVLLWPEIWADTRFVIPIIPFAIYALFWSVRDLLSRVPIPEPYGLWVPYAFGAIVLLAHGTRSATTQIDHAPYSRGWRNYFDSAQWIRENTPPDALIVCRKPFLMNVISGRKTIGYPWFRPRPLLRSFNESGADYVVRDAIFGTTRKFLNPAIARYPQSFLTVQIFEESGTVVYEYLEYEEDGNVKKLDAKLANLNRLIEQDGENEAIWRTLYALGTMYHQMNELGRARKIYERVLPVLEQANVSLNLGILHYSEDRFKASIVAFANAANRDPSDPEARLGLAQAYERVGKFDEAMKQAKAAYQLNGKSTDALHVIARAAVALKKDKEAEEAFGQALKLDPKSPAVRNDLAFFFLKRRRFEEARVLLESLIQDDPERTEYRLNLITALTHLDKTETARNYLSDLLTNHRTQITQGPLKGIANKIIHDLAEKMGTTAEALIDALEKASR
jgi:tetratricopeptide (TPR) repeat protein